MLKKIFFIILFLALINLAIADTYKMRFNPHTNKSDWVINQLSADNVSLDSALDGKILFNANGAISSDNELLYNKDTNRLTVSYISADGSLLSNIPAGNPAGLDTQVQFNDGGSFGGDVGFTYNKTTDTASIGALDLTTALPDAEVADDITLTNITQITNRSHASLTDIGTNTHAQVDSHISDTSDPHGADMTVSGSFGIPNGVNPTVNAAGEIAHDTSDDQLLYGATPRVLAYTYERCFTIEDVAAADDNVPIWSPNDAITITGLYCRTQGGTSASITISDGTNAMEEVICDSDGQADDGTLVNNTFTANERMEFDTGTVTGAVDWCNMCIKYTVDRQ